MRPHSIAYYVKVCGDCGQGQLVITKNPKTGEIFVMCDECMSEWKNPEVRQTENRLQSERNWKEIKNATLEEIQTLGWDKYIQGNYMDYECV